MRISMNKLIGIGVLLLAYGGAWAGAQEDDLIRLANSGIDAEVLTAYVDAAKGPFHLTADQIIELNKLGVSKQVISAALKHDGKAETSPNGGQAESYPYPGNANYPAAAANGSYSTPAAPSVARDTVTVATSPDVEVYPYPDPYYDYWPYYGYWPYVSLGWWWGPSYGWWGGYYGHGYYGHGPGVRGGSPGFHSGGQVGRGAWGGGSRAAWGGSRGGGRSGGGGGGGGRGGGRR